MRIVLGIKKCAFATFLFTATFFCTSCDDEKDGDWPPIKLSKSSITVRAYGGEETITVKNYSGIWLTHHKYDGIYCEDFSKSLDQNNKEGSCDHLTAITDGKTITIKVSPNPDNDPHKMELGLECGDAFKAITINIEAPEPWQFFKNE